MTQLQNTITNQDGQRVCEYGPCEYICNVGDTLSVVPDRTTYDMYYAEEEVLKVAEDIRKKLVNNSFINISSYQPSIVLRALQHLTTITNKYGITGYTKTDDSTIYVSKTLYDNSDSGNMFYFSNPIFQKSVPFSSISTELLYTRRIPFIIDDLSDTLDHDIIAELPLVVQEELLEKSLLAPTSRIQQFITNFFTKYIHNVDNTTVSSFPYSSTHNMRCMTNKEWYDCPQSTVDSILSHKQDIESRAVDFGYYGVSDKTKFLVKIAQPHTKDKRLAPRGRVCATIDKSELQSIMTKAGLTYDETKSKKNECIKLRDWFAENYLMVYL
jgi:hypothetical protein